MHTKIGRIYAVKKNEAVITGDAFFLSKEKSGF